ncbi:MAG: RluA family pseudouridine synthase [Oscillospiraceae bacterium]|nr:RluA family pseudouridine synthase [Oscillospiraceae bacterium]
MQKLVYTIPESYGGCTVQQFLRGCAGLSWRMVVKLKRVPGGITLDGRPVRTIDRVGAGGRLVLLLPEDTVRIDGVDLPLDVVYEDPYLLVVNKPPLLAVHPSAFKAGPTLANIVVHHFAQSGQPLSFRPLNRLDRNTSGLLLAAKNAHIAHALTTHAANSKIEKFYLALALGRLEGGGVIDQPIRIREGSAITREVAGPGDAGGKPSVTHWESLAACDTLSLLRIRLETGRTHQIRVHMAWIGHPLAGDTMYGEDQTVMSRHGLHCAEMSFTHPVNGAAMRFQQELPEDMRRVVAEYFGEDFVL